jgi:uroporphyrinogen decarboxylase
VNKTIGWLDRIIKKPRPDFNQLLKILTKSDVPEYVPSYELFLNVEVMETILDKKLPDRAATVEFYCKAGYDYVPAWPRVDLVVGSLIDTSSHYPIRNFADFTAYQWPDKNFIDFSEFESIIPILPDGMKIIGQTGGIFETAQTLMGYVGLCFALADAPELVEMVLERLGELYVAMYEGMAAIDEVGALVISDDMGYKTQTMISAAHLRKLILPYHKKLADISHKHGKPVILHSCGQLSEIMEDLIEYVGIDAKHSFEDQILPVKEAYQKYGDRISILGGFDLDRLCRSTEEEVRNYTRMLVEELGNKGGYAVGSGNSIAGYVPIRNYLAMIETVWEMRSGR